MRQLTTKASAAPVADLDSRFNRFATNLEDIRSAQQVIRWIAAFGLAFTLAVVWKMFTCPLLIKRQLPR
jgi:hypothetical protein